MALVSFETVAAAAETLVAAGQRVSVRSVIAHLGGGSPNSVLKNLGEWKSGRPLVRMSDTNLDARIITAIVDQMQRVAVEASAASEERAAGTEDDLQALSEAQHELEQQIASLTAERDAARESASIVQDQLRELEVSTEREHRHSVEQTTGLRKDLAEAHKHQEQTVTQLAKVEVRLEEVPKLHSDVERLRTVLEIESKARIVAEQSTAVLAVRLEACENRSAELDARAKKSDAVVDEARAAAKRAIEEAAELRGKVSVFETNAAKNIPTPPVANS